MLPAFATGAERELEALSERELFQLERGKDYLTSGNGYVAIQSTRPQTLAYGLNDSPVGLLSWILEKFWAWTENDGRDIGAVSVDDLLTNVSIYWFTGTAGSAARMYYESLGSGAVLSPNVRGVPLGVCNFPYEILAGPRAWAERDHDLVHWTDAPHGGHFAALEAPETLLADVRTFFRLVR
jgi:microsomal epoxide hydrolase